jgi:sugar phosphate isomerase/epimerase
VETFRRLEAETTGNIGVNLDPSHFWWQGADPLAIVEELGPFIGHCHGKDTKIYPERVRVHGVLDARYPVRAAEASWHFASIGTGHDLDTWRALLAAVRAAGYDGVVSIEHEDPSYASQEDGILVSLANLLKVVD